MRTLLFLAVTLSSGAAMAQGGASSPAPPATAGPVFEPNTAAPVDPVGLSYGSGVTPTMVREHATRTARVYARYPGLKERVEQVRDQRGYRQAQRVYAEAEKKARWERPDSGR